MDTAPAAIEPPPVEAAHRCHAPEDAPEHREEQEEEMMVAIPLESPRRDPTANEALTRVERGEGPHGYATVRQHLVWKHGEKPKDVLLRMLLRMGEE